MSMQSEGKDAKGRNYHQSTHDGTGSAASVGTGGTGDIGAMGSENAGGSRQSASRSDDLLAGDTSQQEAEQAFGGASQGGALRTGMEGIDSGGKDGKGGSRQAEQPGTRQAADTQRQGGLPASQTDDDQYDQGTAAKER